MGSAPPGALPFYVTRNFDKLRWVGYDAASGVVLCHFLERWWQMASEDRKGVCAFLDISNILYQAPRFSRVADYEKMILKGFEHMVDWLRSCGELLRINLARSPNQCARFNRLWDIIWKTYRDEIRIGLFCAPDSEGEESSRKQEGVDELLTYEVNWDEEWIAQHCWLFVLGSGDRDYSTPLHRLHRGDPERGIGPVEIGFVVGNQRSLAPCYRKSNFIGHHPETGEELVHYFDFYRP